MKNILTAIFLVILMTSCDLVDVVDLEPQDVLTEESAIRNQETAELALAGVYSKMNNNNLVISNNQMILLMGIEAEPGGYQGSSNSQYYINNIDSEANNVVAVYSGMYDAINRANYIINKLPQLSDDLFDENRKTEILAEARFMRALYHFYLLREYGQFWDLESEYGIPLKNKPTKDITVIPRSNVQESYEFILDDFEFAIANSPSDNSAIYANPYAAKGFKARILLYMGQYEEAATVAKDVIDNSPFTLEPTFGAVFENSFNSSEMMFASYFDGDEVNSSGTAWFLFMSISSYYVQSANDVGDTRVDYLQYESQFFGLINGKYRTPTTGSTTIHMRLAEMYLLYAEALARSGGPLTDSDSAINDVEDALNTIRSRANMADTEASTREEFINAIRQEKFLELEAEQGEPWYDLIRYAILDGVDISVIKPTIQSKNQYILPIPYTEVNASKGVIKQNPGY